MDSLCLERNETTWDQLESCTEFTKIEDISWSNKGSILIEFIENVLYTFPIMLPHISNIYVLIASPKFPQDNLNEEQKQLFETNGKYIVGYIWLSKISYQTQINVECNGSIEKNPKDFQTNHFIEFIDTLVHGHHIARYMIEKYEEMEKCVKLFPHEMMYDARMYWKKYYKHVYGVTNNIELDDMIIKYGIRPDTINWSELRKIL